MYVCMYVSTKQPLIVPLGIKSRLVKALITPIPINPVHSPHTHPLRYNPDNPDQFDDVTNTRHETRAEREQERETK